MDPVAHRGAARAPRARRADSHPVPAERGRGVRDVPADQVRRPAPVLPGGRRVADPAGRRRDQPGRRGPSRRGRDRHGAPRPAQRAGQHRRQVLRADLQGVRGQPRPEVHPGLGRREVPPGRRRHLHRRHRRQDPHLAGRQPEPPGSGRPGDGGRRPRQAGHPGQGRARLHRAAGPHPRRRRVRRPGRRGRDPEPEPAARLPDRRHRAHRGEQPGRLHYLAARIPVQRVRDRRGADDPGPDLPRQRGRPRGRGAGRPPGLRLPAGVPQGRRDRHGSATGAGGTTRPTTRASLSR